MQQKWIFQTYGMPSRRISAMTTPEDWAPDACTLPTTERPMRVAEFDELFTAVVRFERPVRTRLDLVLPVGAEARARDLAVRESRCCSFFAFDFDFGPDGDSVLMTINVPATQIDVLDAFVQRMAR
jgi:hypothetical protein